MEIHTIQKEGLIPLELQVFDFTDDTERVITKTVFKEPLPNIDLTSSDDEVEIIEKEAVVKTEEKEEEEGEEEKAVVQIEKKKEKVTFTQKLAKAEKDVERNVREWIKGVKTDFARNNNLDYLQQRKAELILNMEIGYSVLEICIFCGGGTCSRCKKWAGPKGIPRNKKMCPECVSDYIHEECPKLTVTEQRLIIDPYYKQLDKCFDYVSGLIDTVQSKIRMKRKASQRENRKELKKKVVEEVKSIKKLRVRTLTEKERKEVDNGEETETDSDIGEMFYDDWPVKKEKADEKEPKKKKLFDIDKIIEKAEKTGIKLEDDCTKQVTKESDERLNNMKEAIEHEVVKDPRRKSKSTFHSAVERLENRYTQHPILPFKEHPAVDQVKGEIDITGLRDIDRKLVDHFIERRGREQLNKDPLRRSFLEDRPYELPVQIQRQKRGIESSSPSSSPSSSSSSSSSSSLVVVVDRPRCNTDFNLSSAIIPRVKLEKKGDPLSIFKTTPSVVLSLPPLPLPKSLLDTVISEGKYLSASRSSSLAPLPPSLVTIPRVKLEHIANPLLMFTSSRPPVPPKS